MFRRAMLCPLLALLLHYVDAAQLHVKVLDKTGTAFPDVLLIVKSLDGKGEVFRALTDAAGGAPGRELLPGLYRAIATCPYGICETRALEFLVGDVPVDLDLTVDVSPTRGNVVQIGPPKSLRIEVVGSDRKPAHLARVLVRDSEALNEQWYTADANGSATVELPEGPVTVVVLDGATLTAETIPAKIAQGLQSKGEKLTVRLK